MKSFFLLLSTIIIIVSCKNQTEVADSSLIIDGIEVSDTVSINDIQLLGTHNSYSKPIDSSVLKLAGKIIEPMKANYVKSMPDEMKKRYKENHPNQVSFAEGLSYAHPNFLSQLNNGIRSFEIDVYRDTIGGLFSKPAVIDLLEQQGIDEYLPLDTLGLSKPGLKVLHIPDIDYRTHYTTFQNALVDLNNWSDKHPNHVPIVVFIEAKSSGIPIFENSTKVIPFDKKGFEDLDREIVQVIHKEKIITPDLVRGNYSTLKEAVLADNWPSLASSKGKFMFLLLPSTAGIGNQNDYVRNHLNLENRICFVQSEPKDDYAAFILRDNAIQRKREIKALVKQGFFVRTRSDIETYEAKVDDYTRAKAAFESNAQIISTDYFLEENNYGTDYKVELPNKKVFRVIK